MKKINLILLVLIGISLSCTKNFEDFNTDKKRPVEVPSQFLFANAQKALADQTASTNVNLNNWKLFAQYFTETTYTEESNYDVFTRNCGNLLFRTYYRDILADLKDAKRIITGEAVIGDIQIAEKQNRLYIIDILECYIYQELVDTFGDIPYTEALDIDNLSPVYDDALTIYKDLISRTQASVTGLDATNGSFGADDLYMAGDVSMWKKFANTLLVKMAINISNVDPGYAGPIIEGAYAGGFAMGEHCSLAYPGGSNSNPLYLDLIASGRQDFVPANTIIDIMNTLTDPRRATYFTTIGEGEYQGGLYGVISPFDQLSHIADPVQDPSYPMVILDYTELAFYLAEAAEKGFSVGGSAATWYENGIRSSFSTWGAANVDSYLTQPNVAYATASGNWKEKIGTQAWLAYYVRGFQGWTSFRRLGYPVMNVPPTPEASSGGVVPRRHTYPVGEQTLNAASYAAAASAIGGDELSTKLFWDNN
jgi:hypothetical protein